MEQSISLSQTIGIIRKHILVILIWGFIFGIGAWALATFVITPKYSAETQLLVSRKNTNSVDNGAQYADQQADVQMITTYKDIITNQVILDKVSDELKNPSTEIVKPAVKAKYERTYTGKRVLVQAAKPAVTKQSSGRTYDISADQLKKSIKVSNQQNSQVFGVTVTMADPEEAARVANICARVFKSQIKKIMAVNNVTIISKATVNKRKVAPRTGLLTVGGVLLGVVVGLMYAFLRELTDRTVKDETVLTDTLGLTNLGHVSKISGQGRLSILRGVSEGNHHDHGDKTVKAEGSSRVREPKHLSNRV